MTKEWSHGTPCITHDAVSRALKRRGSRKKGLRLPFVVKEFDVFTQILCTEIEIKIVGFKAVLFSSFLCEFF